MAVPGYFTSTEVFDAQVEQDLKDEGEVQEYKIIAIGAGPHGVLHSNINAKSINRFNEYIQEKKEGQIRDKFPFQSA